jgi:hypothetical protein
MPQGVGEESAEVESAAIVMSRFIVSSRILAPIYGCGGAKYILSEE